MKTTILIITGLLLCLFSKASAAERLENYTNKTVLVFTPHPDDDTFAVGGTMDTYPMERRDRDLSAIREARSMMPCISNNS